MSERIVKVCSICGSDELVVEDALVTWDVETQRWTLADVFQFAICEVCEKKTAIIDKVCPE